MAPGNPFAGSGGCTPQQPAERRRTRTRGTDTNHLVVADHCGDVVSYTNTIEELGGSGIVVPGRGFLLNNELTDFDFAPPSSGAARPEPARPAASARARACRRPSC